MGVAGSLEKHLVYRRRRGLLPWILAITLALAALEAQAAQAAGWRLPLRRYTSADGLAQDQVSRLAVDVDGFVWIATAGGLSRFDGTRFTTYGDAEGLRGRVIEDIAVSRFGTYWVATEAGLFWFRPGQVAPSHRLFQEIAIEGVPANDRPFRLLVSRSGTLWVGTLSKLWRVTPAGDGYAVDPVELSSGGGRPIRSRVQALAEDPDGSIWVGTHSDGIFRIAPNGNVDHCPENVAGASFVRAFHFPGDGSVWTAYFGGVAIFPRAPFPGSARDAARAARLYGTEEGVALDTTALVPIGDDTVLVGTTAGITGMHRSSSGTWRADGTIDRRTGLPGDLVSALVRDAQGNLWVGLGLSGVVELLESGFSTLEDPEVAGAFFVDLAIDREGRVVGLAAKGAKALSAYRPEDDPQATIPVSLPASLTYVGWGGGQKFFVDSRGTWWIATGAGVLRYDDPRREGAQRLRRPPDAVLGVADGLPGRDAFVLAEDSRGDVWISTTVEDGGASSSVSRWSRGTGKIDRFSASEIGSTSLALRFLQARDGSLWILLMDGKLLRYRDGSFQPIGGLPQPGVEGGSDLFQDSRGQVWIIAREAYVCAQPAAAEPRFERREIGPHDDGRMLRCAVEDHGGRLWFGTNQGLLRLDPATGGVRRFTVQDGLVGNSIGLCDRDGSGVLWFSDQNGLSRFKVQAEAPFALESARIREIRVAGEAVALPANGAISMDVLTIPPARRRFAVEFFSIHQGSGPPPRFQYRLEGSDTDWSGPTSDRSIQYADLPTGRYRFQVRTVDEDGTPSDAPASVPLVVLAPLWQQPWFIAVALGLLAGLGYTVYRMRMARVIALERVRTRIATDLHDDIGSSLSQISILSRTAHRRTEGAGGPAPEALERITALSGELIDAMSDVVWAISPRWDTVSALVHRMRRFASELFSDAPTEIDLRLPEGNEAPFDPDARRQIYLIFKEALHNVRRHADAAHVVVELRREGSVWILRVEEDGKGFDTVRESAGHGLVSMRRRAERLGGRLEVRSSARGTTLELTLPEGSARVRGVGILSALARARRNLSNR